VFDLNNSGIKIYDWDGRPQALNTLLKLYHEQHSTDIRDKVYALHSLAHDSADVAIDYSIDPKALLFHVLRHACSHQASQPDVHKARRDMFGFAKMVNEALRVYCPEHVLLWQITQA
jgi:hypothetical protein